MTKICLVTPPSPFLLDEKVFPSLGILKVGAVLEQAGHKVDHIDLCGVSNYEEAVADYHGASIFGITATTPQIPAAIKIGDILRTKMMSKTILGGPHPTLLHAAAKHGNERAQIALDYLLAHFDVVVAGDGEKAIFTALHSRGLVDADDPKGILWNTSKDFTESPWPARHLVDMESYHYHIDGAKATSMIAQLGCLAPDTLITMRNGHKKPISEIIKGEIITCYNVDYKRIEHQPVAEVWKREADDIWEITWGDGTVLKITGEHPVWTQEGWRTVEEISQGTSVAQLSDVSQRVHYPSMLRRARRKILQPKMLQFQNKDSRGEKEKHGKRSKKESESQVYLSGMRENRIVEAVTSEKEGLLLDGVSEETHYDQVPAMRRKFRTDQMLSRDSKILQPPMPLAMATRTSKRQVERIWASGDACEICGDDRRRTTTLLQRGKKQYPEIDTGYSQEAFGYQARRSKSDEAPGSGGESFGNNQGEMGDDFIRTIQEDVERREIGATYSRTEKHTPEQARSKADGYSEECFTRVQVCGECSILDWTLPIREAEESRLHRQEESEGDSFAWGVLAHTGGCGDRSIGLLEQRLGTINHMGDGTPSTKTYTVDGEASLVWRKIISKRFIGKGAVHNITICPTHNYIANGMLVHNCPFHCKFCGGRNSPMLRQIRVRPSDSVVEEMMHLHHHYGITGVMHFQDELNLNHKNMVELMRKIKDTGIEWRQRGFVKAELFNEEQAEAMYAAGFRWLLCGFESAHPKILKNIAKNATREDNTRMLRIAHKHGIKVKALMSAGHPGESEETLLATRDWLLEEKPDDFDVTIITVYPGTPYFDESVCVEEPVYKYTTNGDVLYSEHADFHRDVQYYKGAPGAYKSYVWTDYISRERLCVLRDEVEDEVRKKLGIPYATAAAAINFEHSMGQNLPTSILRSA